MWRFIPAVFLTCGLVSLLMCGTAIYAEDNGGGATFKSLKCGSCHKPDRKSVGPSLKDVAQGYAGQEERLVRYLKGEAEPILGLGKAKLMRKRIKKMQDLPSPELKALALYIMTFK